MKPTIPTYKEEIFGPVLQMVRADGFEEAVGLPTDHHDGHGVAIFTRNGHAAREFASRVNVGMVGINMPIPVPVSYHLAAAGSAPAPATSTSTAWKACVSGPRTRWSHNAGRTEARMGKAPSGKHDHGLVME